MNTLVIILVAAVFLIGAYMLYGRCLLYTSQAVGVHSPKSIRLKEGFSEDELKGLRFPLVIKPINGYGSRGIYVVNSAADIRARFDAVRKYSTERDILAEEYNDGYEFNMMNWVANGTVYVLSICLLYTSRCV